MLRNVDAGVVDVAQVLNRYCETALPGRRGTIQWVDTGFPHERGPLWRDLRRPGPSQNTGAIAFLPSQQPFVEDAFQGLKR